MASLLTGLRCIVNILHSKRNCFVVQREVWLCVCVCCRWISLLSSKDKRSKGSDGRAGQEIKVEMLIRALTDLKVFLTDCSKNKITLYKCRPESYHYYCSVYIDFVKFYKEVSIWQNFKLLFCVFLRSHMKCVS